jgi:hypothetical protein
LELIFNEDLSMVLDLQAIAVAQRWEIHPATQQMVPGKLRDMLTRRYGYAVDDVPLKVVVYGRCSTAEQASNGVSIEVQRRVVER